MAVRTFITPCGEFDKPISHFRTALLTVTMALSVVLCVLLLAIPAETDKIAIDLWSGDSPLMPAIARPLHQLVIDKQGHMAMDGKRVRDQAELRRIVDAQLFEYPVPNLQIEADPELRYEQFIEALLVIKSAHVSRLCIDWDPPEQRTDRLAAARERCPPRPVPVVKQDWLVM